VIHYVGLDFETSCGDHSAWENNAPIQIGLATLNGVLGIDVHSSLIGGWNWFEYHWQEKAADVHGISAKQVDMQSGELKVKDVDLLVSSWLTDRKRTNRYSTVAVGWGVSWFDRPFVSVYFPKLHELLSYRTLDLSSVCLYLANGSEKKHRSIKDAAKSYAAENMSEVLSDVTWHDAGYDAAAALLAKEYLDELIL